MDAPEKIYLTPLECMAASCQPQKDNAVEYTCTDAFIEKAAEWLKSNTLCYVDVSMDFENMELDKRFFKDFQKAMKGE